MTKQGSTNSQAARQGSDVITEEMIDAGIEQFLRDYPETGAGDLLDRRMVSRIYRAMRAVSLGLAGQIKSVNEAA